MFPEFDLTLTRRTVFGAGKLNQLGSLAAEHGRHALLVLGGRSAKRSGALVRARASLAEAEVQCTLFEGVEPDPSVETADRGATVCRESGCDLVIGLGGGSVLDCAKALAILARHEGPAEDYQLGRRKVERKGLPYLAVPTTSGTGSEANRVAVLSNKAEGIKKSIADPQMVPVVALLDPELTLGLPPFETAYTGIDALSHAAETYVSLGANPLTEAYSLRALELIGRHLPSAIEDGSNLEARASLAVASYLGGTSLNAGVGCAHILSHPLGAAFGLPHGVAIAATLPHVFDANQDAAPEKYAQIAEALAPGERLSAGEALRALLDRIGFRPRLGEHGVTPDDFDALYEGVCRSMAHIRTNPRPATRELLLSIFEASR